MMFGVLFEFGGGGVDGGGEGFHGLSLAYFTTETQRHGDLFSREGARCAKERKIKEEGKFSDGGRVVPQVFRGTYRDHTMKFHFYLLFLVSIRPHCRSGYSTNDFTLKHSNVPTWQRLPHTPPCNNMADRRTWRVSWLPRHIPLP